MVGHSRDGRELGHGKPLLPARASSERHGTYVEVLDRLRVEAATPADSLETLQARLRET